MSQFNANGNNSIAYNNFLHMPQVLYKTVERLALSTSSSAENLWKILKHPTIDAIKEPNLTFDEKMAIVWSPDKPNASQQNLFTVFLKPLVPSALDGAEEQIQLKIHDAIVKPNNNIEATIGIQFDMITNEFCSMVYDADDVMVDRTDLMGAYILDCLNGSDLGVGSSMFQFYNRDLSGLSKMLPTINNGKSLYGKSMVLALTYVDAKTGGC